MSDIMIILVIVAAIALRWYQLEFGYDPYFGYGVGSRYQQPYGIKRTMRKLRPSSWDYHSDRSLMPPSWRDTTTVVLKNRNPFSRHAYKTEVYRYT